MSIATWQSFLGEEKEKIYFKRIMDFVKSERSKGKIIYPARNNIFDALKLTPYENVKVVILGQDPYHGPRQAHGLSFSVKPGIKPPPSLVNIFKELKSDLEINPPKQGSLEKWAKQGVLLLNSSLTVEAGKPQSHAHIGWDELTDKIISSLNNHPETIVFLLWGASAQKKEYLINKNKHKVLKAPHPSPLSASRGFFGCRHFSKANELLITSKRSPIDWDLNNPLNESYPG